MLCAGMPYIHIFGDLVPAKFFGYYLRKRENFFHILRTLHSKHYSKIRSTYNSLEKNCEKNIKTCLCQLIFYWA